MRLILSFASAAPARPRPSEMTQALESQLNDSIAAMSVLSRME